VTDIMNQDKNNTKAAPLNHFAIISSLLRNDARMKSPPPCSLMQIKVMTQLAKRQTNLIKEKNTDKSQEEYQ